MATNPTARRWPAIALGVALLAIFTAQVVSTIRGESLTWDEDDHIFAGYESWKTHDYGLNPEHPPMVKMVAALPLLGLDLKVPALQGRFFKNEAYLDGRELLFRNGPANGGHYTAEQLTLRVRLATLIFAVGAGLLVWAAGAEIFGATAGLLALALFCFEPTAIAHSGLVTTDMAASATIFATIYAFWRWSFWRGRRPGSWQRLGVAGVAAGLALAAKHSGVLVAPMLLVLAMGEVIARGRTGPARAGLARAGLARDGLAREALRLAGALVAITVVAVTVLWAFYGFRYAARPAGLALSPSLAAYVGPLAGVEARGILLAGRLHLLPESWLYGLADVRSMANGMQSYFFGRVYEHGVWFYFPVVLLIKMTLGMLALLALTALAAARGWVGDPGSHARARNAHALWFFTLPPALYLGVAMASHLNIGARHVLPLFVFACLLAGAGAAACARRGRGWTLVVGLLLAAHIGSSLRAAPNSMSYANEAWGGPTATYRYLTDSNTDWGQQLLATADYLRERHITHCWFAYFVEPFVQAADYGIPCRMLPTADTMSLHGKDLTVYEVPATIGDGGAEEPVLISAGTLSGYELGSRVLNPYEAFRGVRPVAFLQNGIFVFQGRFAVPLAGALQHVQLSAEALQAGNVADALQQAEVAQWLAPGEVMPEMALGDALAASHRAAEARDAYERARTRIEAMEPEARAEWLAKVQAKEAATR